MKSHIRRVAKFLPSNQGDPIPITTTPETVKGTKTKVLQVLANDQHYLNQENLQQLHQQTNIQIDDNSHQSHTSLPSQPPTSSAAASLMHTIKLEPQLTHISHDSQSSVRSYSKC